MEALLELRVAGEVPHTEIKALAWKRAVLALLDAAQRDVGIGSRTSEPFEAAARKLREPG